MLILAVDPGKMSGWARWHTLEGPSTAEFGELPFYQCQTMMELWTTRKQENLHLVIEDFIITDRTARLARGNINWSIETLGLGRYLAARDKCKFSTQGASKAKRFGSPDILKDLGWWPTSSDHAQDAARHLLLAVARLDVVTFSEIMKGIGR